MPDKNCVDKWYQKRFLVYTLAVGLIIAGVIAVNM